MNEGRSMPPRKSRGWIWFFAVLALLTVASLVILNVFIRGRQLTLEQVRQARAVWDRKGPHDYDMTWSQKGSVQAIYHVRVRDGKPISVNSEDQPLERRLYSSYTMTGLFESIEEFLELDAKPGKPATFTTATFDAADGHVTRFIRQVRGTKELQDITIELTPVAREEALAD